MHHELDQNLLYQNRNFCVTDLLSGVALAFNRLDYRVEIELVT